MKYVIFYIIYGILWLISKSPFWLLYLLADFLYLVLYKLVRYRVKTVRDNLKLTLPHLSDKERKTIEQKFYNHLCDLFLEMIKTMTISKEELNKRFVYTNIDLIKTYEAKGKSIIIMLPHYANWEWIINLQSSFNHQGFAVYKKLANKYFNKLFVDIRSRFGAELINTVETTSKIKSNEVNNLKATYLFLSDQTPPLRGNLHWEPFLGIEVPIHMGAEALARKFDMNILYLHLDKTKRGYYTATFSEITDDVKNTEKYAPTRLFLDKIESQVTNKPELYFWTHKRWKHQGRKEEFKTK